MLTTNNIDTIEGFLGIPQDSFSIENIKGEASDRQYYRVTYEGRNKSAIIMLLPSPVESNLPYIEVQQILQRCGIAVPETYHYEQKEGLLIIEDCGDTSLEQLLLEASCQTEKEKIYKKAIDIIINIQSRVVDEGKGEATFNLAFDQDKLRWELNFMLKYLVEGLLKKKISDGDRKSIENIFANICTELANEPRLFTHRDYHSRNIMVKDNNLILIDFQDARMGPCQYDLVSLLRDSYSPIDNHISTRLINYYIDKKGGIDREIFMRTFNLMTLQRSLKAAGTFAFQSIVKGKDEYLKYLPMALGYAKEAAGEDDDLDEINTFLNSTAISFP